MKFVILLAMCVGLATAQFFNGGGFGGGFGGGLGGGLGGALGNAGNVFQQGLSSFAGGLPVLSNVQSFADFAAQTGRNYASAADRALRETLFNSRKSLVDSNNAAFAAGRSSFETAINAFADLTNAEFLKELTGLKKSPSGEEKAKRVRQLPRTSPNARIPDAFDWRQQGGVTPVKFQGKCGSCWSFATTGAIEGHVFRKTGQLINLSEQHLIDCGQIDDGLDGCDGGFQEYAFQYITNHRGISDGSKYPYVDRKDSCHYQSQLKGAEIQGFAVITPKDEQTMKQVVATLGPLACSVNGLESLILYKRGIYNDEECNKGEPNHSVLVVGYGSENGQDYWIVKNSWDTVWGEEGYFRLPRGRNFCGIALECSYPIV